MSIPMPQDRANFFKDMAKGINARRQAAMDNAHDVQGQTSGNMTPAPGSLDTASTDQGMQEAGTVSPVTTHYHEVSRAVSQTFDSSFMPFQEDPPTLEDWFEDLDLAMNERCTHKLAQDLRLHDMAHEHETPYEGELSSCECCTRTHTHSWHPLAGDSLFAAATLARSLYASDDMGSSHDVDDSIKYWTAGVHGDELRERIARKFRRLRLSQWHSSSSIFKTSL